MSKEDNLDFKNEYLYEVEARGILIKEYIGKEQRVTIPEIIENKKVTKIASEAFEGKNLSFKLDGPSVPNKSEALKQIEEYLPQIANENVGKLSGGLLTISLSFINIQIPHLGEIIRIDDSNLSGSCYIGKFNGTKRSDFYHFDLCCNEPKYPCCSLR